MNDNSPMPFGLPEGSEEFTRRIEEVKEGLRKQFGANVPATSAVDEALLKSVEDLRNGKTPTGFWLRVTRRALDLLRRRQRHARALERVARDTADDSGDPIEQLAARELYDRLLSAAAALSETERSVWLLHCEGKTESEIGQELKKSHPAVKMALSRARQHVRERMADLAARKE
ncbi:MAG: RNA polymerase sigma factor [Gemmataceae bacterium]